MHKRLFISYRDKQRHRTDIIKEAIKHNGYALVDIFDPCPTFNKTNTFKWYKEHTYKLEEHDPYNREKAISLAFKNLDEEMFGLGIIYRKDNVPTMEENIELYKSDKTPLYERRVDVNKVLEKLKP